MRLGGWKLSLDGQKGGRGKVGRVAERVIWIPLEEKGEGKITIV